MSKNCCCESAAQITCAQWCDCLPLTATVHGLSIDIDVKTYCGNAIQNERIIALNITNVNLVNTGLCYMISDANSGAFSFSDVEKTFAPPPDGIANYLGCPGVNCIQQCDHRELCRTFTTSASGVNPGISIHCDNPCQEPVPFSVTDAFTRLDWFIDGDVFTMSDIGSNAYPDQNAHLACRFPSADPSFQNNTCASVFNSTIGPGYSSRGGSIFGRRGCFSNASFTRFNACSSYGTLIDPNVVPPIFGSGFCSNPLSLPQCYNCGGGTMNPVEQISSATYTVESCAVNECCGGHDCYNYNNTTSPQVELFCCGGIVCNTCQTNNGIGSGNVYLPQRTVYTLRTQLLVTVP